MKVGDRVKERGHGAGTVVWMDGKKEYFESRQWWAVKLDSQQDYEQPYHFLQRDLESIYRLGGKK